LLKIVAEEYAKKKIRHILSYLSTALLILLTSGFFMLSVILLFRHPIACLFRLTGDNYSVFQSLLPYVGLLSIVALLVQPLFAVIAGLGRMDIANASQGAIRILTVCISAGLLMAGFGIESLIIGNAVAHLIIASTAIAILSNKLQRFPLVIAIAGRIQRKKLLGMSGGLFGSSLIYMLISPFNKLIIARFIGIQFIPVYEIAYNGAMQIRAFSDAALRPLIPELSKLYAHLLPQNIDRIRNLNKKAFRLILSYGMIVHCLAVLVCRPVIKVWLQARYQADIPFAFQVMVVGSYLSLLNVPAYYTLIAMGKVANCFKASVIQMASNVVIIAFLLLFGAPLGIPAIAFAVVFSMGLATSYVLSITRIAMNDLKPVK
jgi:O-antigen/teichoic acid export membrane protein